MTREVAGLLLANVLILATGVGLLPLLRIARTRQEIVARAGLSYLVGLAFVGVVSATLSLVRVSFGWPALAGLTTIALVLGYPALRRREPLAAPPRLSRRDATVTGLCGLGTLALLARAALSFSARPLLDWDAWHLWTLKARALATLGWADPSFFVTVRHPRYPLLLSSLEAIVIRAMGTYDPQLVDVQFALLCLASIAALAALLWDRVPALLLWPLLLAIVTAPSLLGQLSTAYADVPLALFVAIAVAAAGRWLLSAEQWCLNLATLLLATALLTKSEGLLAVVVVLAALALSAGRHRLRPVLASAAVVFSAGIPWWAYISAFSAGEDDYKLTDAVRLVYVAGRAERARQGLGALLGHLFDVSEWSLLGPLFVAAICVAACTRRRTLVRFGLIVTLGYLAGLALVYDISPQPIGWYIGVTAYRVVATVVLSAAALTPLVVAEALSSRESVPNPMPRRRRAVRAPGAAGRA